MSQSVEEADLVRRYLGPVLVATSLNAFLYGICCLQFIWYQRNRTQDTFWNQFLVAWVFLINTVHTAITIVLAWHYAITYFGNFNALEGRPWAYLVSPIFNASISTPIQYFFAWRVKHFSRHWVWFCGLAILSIVAFTISLVNVALAFHHFTFSRWAPMLEAGLALSAWVDALIAGSLLYYFSRSRTGFRRTDNVVTKLIHYCVETSALNSIASLVDLLLNATTNKTSNYCTLLTFPLGRIYTITLLTFLNSRMGLKAEIYGVTEIDITEREQRRGRVPNAAPRHTEVCVAVEQQIKMEVAVDAFSKNLKAHRKQKKNQDIPPQSSPSPEPYFKFASVEGTESKETVVIS